MRKKFNLLIKSCGTRTVPAAETKSIVLAADARAVMVFASPSGQFYNDVTTETYLSGQRHNKNIYLQENDNSAIVIGKDLQIIEMQIR